MPVAELNPQSPGGNQKSADLDHQKEIDRDLKRNADMERGRGQARELAAA
jgi:hypothetical protein